MRWMLLHFSDRGTYRSNALQRCQKWSILVSVNFSTKWRSKMFYYTEGGWNQKLMLMPTVWVIWAPKADVTLTPLNKVANAQSSNFGHLCIFNWKVDFTMLNLNLLHNSESSTQPLWSVNYRFSLLSRLKTVFLLVIFNHDVFQTWI